MRLTRIIEKDLSFGTLQTYRQGVSSSYVDGSWWWMKNVQTYWYLFHWIYILLKKNCKHCLYGFTQLRIMHKYCDSEKPESWIRNLYLELGKNLSSKIFSGSHIMTVNDCLIDHLKSALLYRNTFGNQVTGVSIFPIHQIVVAFWKTIISLTSF